MPQLPWLPAVTLLALAIVEFALAQQTRARIERSRAGRRWSRWPWPGYVVLAKASSLAGAIFAGFSAGLTSWLLIDGQTLRRGAPDDLPAAIASLIASLALVGAALWLERACRVPEQPDETGRIDRSR